MKRNPFSSATVKHVIKDMTLDQTKRRIFYGTMSGVVDEEKWLRIEAVWDNWNGYYIDSGTSFGKDEHVY